MTPEAFRVQEHPPPSEVTDEERIRLLLPFMGQRRPSPPPDNFIALAMNPDVVQTQLRGALGDLDKQDFHASLLHARVLEETNTSSLAYRVALEALNVSGKGTHRYCPLSTVSPNGMGLCGPTHSQCFRKEVSQEGTAAGQLVTTLQAASPFRNQTFVPDSTQSNKKGLEKEH